MKTLVWRLPLWLGLSVVQVVAVPLGMAAQATEPSRELITSTPEGNPGDNRQVNVVSVSADGRYIYFNARSLDLVSAGNPSLLSAGYVRDRVTGVTTQITVDRDGTALDGQARGQSMSADGSKVLYSQLGSDGFTRTYLVDRSSGTTSMVCGQTTPWLGPGSGKYPCSRTELSGDGRFMTFMASETFGFLSSSPIDGIYRAFIKNVETGSVQILHPMMEFSQCTWDGRSPTGCNSYGPVSDFSGDHVAFYSELAISPADTNRRVDVYLWDRESGASTLVDTSIPGTGPFSGEDLVMSRSGRFLGWRYPGAGVGGIVVKDLRTGHIRVIPNAGDFSIADDGTIVYEKYVNDISWITVQLSDGSTRDLGFRGFLAPMSVAGDSTVVAFGVGPEYDLGFNRPQVWVAPIRLPDTAPPAVTGFPDSQPNEAGWYNHDVSIEWHAEDPLPSSGGPTDPPNTNVSDEGDSVLIMSEPSCDLAGNCTRGEMRMSLDKTPPSISAEVSPLATPAGWRNSDALVSFSCQDALSGIALCPPDVVVSREGAGQVISATAWDAAGNATTVSVADISIDRGGPSIEASISPDVNAAGWRRETTTVVFSCQDSLSGVEECSGPVTFLEGRDMEATGEAVDRAGNRTSLSVSGIHVDMTSPRLEFRGVEPTYTIDEYVDIVCDVDDSLSGVSTHTCRDMSKPASSFEPGTNQISAEAVDVAGNATHAAIILNVIATPESLGILIDGYADTSAAAQRFRKHLARVVQAMDETKRYEKELARFLEEVEGAVGEALTSEEAATLSKWVVKLESG